MLKLHGPALHRDLHHDRVQHIAVSIVMPHARGSGMSVGAPSLLGSSGDCTHCTLSMTVYRGLVSRPLSCAYTFAHLTHQQPHSLHQR